MTITYDDDGTEIVATYCYVISVAILLPASFAEKETKKPLFSCLQNSKILQDFSSYRIFERIHEVLNM